MKFKGMDTLSEHVPELNSIGGKVRTTLYAIFLFTIVTIYFIVTDNIPTWSIDSQIIIIALGFIVLSLFFSRKQIYKEKYKELAYRNAFAHFIMPGLALIFAATVHAGYMNGPFIPQGWWTIIFRALGWFMLCIGSILWIRSILHLVQIISHGYTFTILKKENLSTSAFMASRATRFTRVSCPLASGLHCLTAMRTPSHLPSFYRSDS